MDVKVLGSGCANCKNTAALVAQVAQDKGVEIALSKVEDMRDIMSYGILATTHVSGMKTISV